MIPLFDWPAKRLKCIKNYVTQNPDRFQDTPDLAEDFDSPICLVYTTAKMVTIFKNVIPCSWQRYSWYPMLLTKLILKSFQKKMEESSSCHACFALVMLSLSCHALLWSCFHDLLDFSMLLLTKSAPKTKILALQLIPYVLETKREIHYSPITIHYHYSSVTVHDTVHSEFLPI